MVNAAQGSRGSGRDTYGLVYRIVRWMDGSKGAFFVSRLILHTGIKLRGFDARTADDALVLERLWPAIDELLSPEERVDLVNALRQTTRAVEGDR